MNLHFSDGEVIGLDNDGCVICWDADKKELYNTGVSMAEFGSMTEIEIARCTKS